MEWIKNIGIVVGVLSGVVGTILGIMNLRHQRRISMPRIRVRPRVMHLVDRTPHIGRDMSERNVCMMELNNIGRIPVHGSIIGFHARKGEKGYLVVSPQPVGGGDWPAEISPGKSVSLRMDVSGMIGDIREGKVGRAFMTSAVNEGFVASRRDTDEFFKAVLEVYSTNNSVK